MSEPKHPGGRPPYKPNASDRRKVAIAAGGGMSHEQIAIALGITRNTLLKYFSEELTLGAYKKRMELLEILHKTAKKGSVTAAREYFKHEPGVTAPPPTDQEQSPAPKKGKKEQAQEEAQIAAVGTEWEDLLRQPPDTIQ